MNEIQVKISAIIDDEFIVALKELVRDVVKEELAKVNTYTVNVSPTVNSNDTGKFMEQFRTLIANLK